MADVFISYHEASAGELAEEIADRLEDAGISCWCARRDMPLGGDFARSIPAQIDSCKVFLLLLNENVYKSRHIESELGLAFSRWNHEEDIQILPLEIGNFTRRDWIRYYLIHAQSDKFPENPDEQRIQKLVKRIARLLVKEPAPQQKKSLPPTSIHTQSDKVPENPDKQRPQGLLKWFEKLLGKEPAPQQKPKPESPIQTPPPKVKPEPPKEELKPLAKIVKRGKCGDNVNFTLDENGVLTISGTGAMWGFVWNDEAHLGKTLPWWNERDIISHVEIQNGVTTIGKRAFRHCWAMTSVTIPNSVTYIGREAFCGCNRLKSITIPDSVTYIGWEVFCGCYGLISVILPDSVTEIGDWAFQQCINLKSITIPDSVIKIRHLAFEGCNGLTIVSVPAKADIHPEAFPPHVRIERRV